MIFGNKNIWIENYINDQTDSRFDGDVKIQELKRFSDWSRGQMNSWGSCISILQTGLSDSIPDGQLSVFGDGGRWKELGDILPLSSL